MNRTQKALNSMGPRQPRTAATKEERSIGPRQPSPPPKPASDPKPSK